MALHDAPTVIIPRPRTRRPRWRRWCLIVPAAVLTVLIAITALGAAIGPPSAGKAAAVKTSAAYLP